MNVIPDLPLTEYSYWINAILCRVLFNQRSFTYVMSYLIPSNHKIFFREFYTRCNPRKSLLIEILIWLFDSSGTAHLASPAPSTSLEGDACEDVLLYLLVPPCYRVIHHNQVSGTRHSAFGCGAHGCLLEAMLDPHFFAKRRLLTANNE